MKSKFMPLVVLACATIQTYAETKEPVDSLKVYSLQGVQVTATRANQETPIAFTSLSQQQIKNVNFGQDIPYILSLTPSITTTSDAGNGIGYTSIRVRGIDPSRVNITANGIPMNDAESSQVYWVNMGDFASSVQNMQIQRGAGTSTNGSGAFGASLNMQTENIGVNPFFGIDISAGSYYSHKETLRFGTGLIGEHWGIQGRLSNIGSKGYLDRASTKLNSYFLQGGYFSDNTMIKFITWNGTEQTYHAWNYASKYEQSLYGRTYNSCGKYKDENGVTQYYKDQNDNYHQQNYQLIWNQILNNNWNFSTALHYTKGFGYYDEYKKGQDLRDYGLSDIEYTTDLTRQKKMANDFYGAVASINYNNNNDFSATLGGGWNKYDGDHFGIVKWVKKPAKTFYPNYEYYRNNALKSDFNIYGKAQWEFVKKLNAYIDLQYRHVGYRLQDPKENSSADKSGAYKIHDDFDFFNPKFGLNYQIDNHSKAYFSYAISHKEPTRNDYKNNKVEHLQAEGLQDFELGYKYENSNFSAGINLYHMYYNHQYVLTGALNEIGEMIASNRNSGKSYRTGIEMETAWKPVNWFRWDVNATLAKAINKDWTITADKLDKDGNFITYIDTNDDNKVKKVTETVNLGDTHTTFSPDFIFNNIFTFTYKGFNLSLQSQYIGEQYLTNSDFKSYVTTDDDNKEVNIGMMLEGYFNTNIDLSYNFGLKKLGIKDAKIGVSLYNIFNTKYDNNGWADPHYKVATDGNVTAYTEGDLYEAGFAPSAPFNFMAHLSLNF